MKDMAITLPASHALDPEGGFALCLLNRFAFDDGRAKSYIFYFLCEAFWRKAGGIVYDNCRIENKVDRDTSNTGKRVQVR